jgi:hypothetical protein
MDARRGLPNRYLANADVHASKRAAECRYSPEMALQAVRDRVEYLLARGSTVNNRKISRRYVIEHCQELKGPRWALELQRAVEAALAAEPPVAEQPAAVAGTAEPILDAEASLEAEAMLDLDVAAGPPGAPTT